MKDQIVLYGNLYEPAPGCYEFGLLYKTEDSCKMNIGTGAIARVQQITIELSPPIVKPCPVPWCKENAANIKSDYPNKGARKYKVKCQKCGCHTPFFELEKDAVKCWNGI